MVAPIKAASSLQKIRQPKKELPEGQYASKVDLQGLVSDFAKIAGTDAAQKMVGEVIQVKAEEIRTLASRYAPKKTGELAGSIHIEHAHDWTWAEIKPDKHYAQYQEYGTAQRGEYPGGQPYEIKPSTKKALRFSYQGKVRFAKRVIHPGVPPSPYMRPATVEALRDLQPHVAKGAIAMIVNTPAAKRAR